MRKERLPADSARYAEMAFREKEALRRRRSRMSLARKLEMLDRLLAASKELPGLVTPRDR
jgi:hypothetical protein